MDDEEEENDDDAMDDDDDDVARARKIRDRCSSFMTITRSYIASNSNVNVVPTSVLVCAHKPKDSHRWIVAAVGIPSSLPSK